MILNLFPLYLHVILNYQNIDLFKKTSKGTIISRLFSQLSMLFNNLGADGGLFIVVGKKK